MYFSRGHKGGQGAVTPSGTFTGVALQL